MTAPERFRVDVVQDRPPSGMWHCGPNPSWVTVTHLPTMTQARAYHHSQHKARAAAMACVQMMIEELLVTDDVCNYPEALAASPEVAKRVADAEARGMELAAEILAVRADVLLVDAGADAELVRVLDASVAAIRTAATSLRTGEAG